MERRATVERRTLESNIFVDVLLDGQGTAKSKTNIKFLDHMIATLATHSMMDVVVEATGDLTHHIVEDVALTLGSAISKALDNREGIKRFGYAVIAMDDALSVVSVDLVKRPYAIVKLKIDGPQIEDIAKEDIYHFFRSFAFSLESTMHVLVLYGENDHHKVEAATKALAISLRQAMSFDERRRQASVKGTL
ncbi:MAG: imidazoleglycerol-phosphate dehydratase [Thaumarchaeota archaeon]|jgi:imidazoleglycerol-phosphate dehydratase|nr:imidazoleglycerol-phosphate dehydratase [Candidatus Terraquivivens yellowstonensis]MCL7387496.1 imidazoleglycerol-phosphate dehydratase [Candidatus Terraquivivens yellowstonensis]MCL7392154.1 imidazoleglycerol-phosphate dehydratase [Candidatus Terraquivivens yellowstonensis]MCL7395116.1 imidazoleglycerol-phosphate dehydratase [Candidatus Terraquivivens yellowstonensis]MCL7397956.1 imidazoleglycerol-phosphate dehydratase [Candidatus Terraquivivens yellowstonensis]